MFGVDLFGQGQTSRAILLGHHDDSSLNSGLSEQLIASQERISFVDLGSSWRSESVSPSVNNRGVARVFPFKMVSYNAAAFETRRVAVSSITSVTHIVSIVCLIGCNTSLLPSDTSHKQLKNSSRDAQDYTKRTVNSRIGHVHLGTTGQVNCQSARESQPYEARNS